MAFWWIFDHYCFDQFQSSDWQLRDSSTPIGWNLISFRKMICFLYLCLTVETPLENITKATLIGVANCSFKHCIPSPYTHTHTHSLKSLEGPLQLYIIHYFICTNSSFVWTPVIWSSWKSSNSTLNTLNPYLLEASRCVCVYLQILI